MKNLLIHTKELQKDKKFILNIGNNILKDLQQLIPFDNYSKVVVLTDTNLEKLWLQHVLQYLPQDTKTVIIKSGEIEKNIDTVQTIWQQLLDLGCDRKSLVINLGGGVITDMGGFAASTFMRGIDFINIPTTVLSQVDASVGGKTGIDFAGIKNLIGLFKQPLQVIIDTATLQTLPDRVYKEGFGEIIKHGLIQDKKYFDLVTSKKPEEFTADELVDIVVGSCEIKAKIVNNDEREINTRKLLNFGHTIGHAIEAAALTTEEPMLHGEAVGIGMVAEARISQLLNNISEDDVEMIKKRLQNAGLPVTMNFPEQVLFSKMTADKKKAFGKIHWTLLKQIGEAVYDLEVPEEIVKKGIEFIQS